MNLKKGDRMSVKEIKELLRLKGWDKTMLAIQLGVGESTVDKWLRGVNPAAGPAAKLMQQWLNEERGGVATK